MSGVVVVLLCISVRTLPLAIAIGDRSDLCSNDGCVDEVDRGMSLVQLKAKNSSNSSNSSSRWGHITVPCQWTKHVSRGFSEQHIRASPPKELGDNMYPDDCKLLAVKDSECVCPHMVSMRERQEGRVLCHCATSPREKFQGYVEDNTSNIEEATCFIGECDVFGDPHIKVFDQQVGAASLLSIEPLFSSRPLQEELGAFETGDFWLVKSMLVQIQGRFTKVRRGEGKKPFLTAVALGGPVVGGNKLVIEPRKGKVTWNGENILTDLTSEFVFDNLIDIRYHNATRIVEGPSPQLRLTTGLDIYLPKRDLHILVNRFPMFLGLRVKMSEQAAGTGVDGMCGNFNGIPSDDTANLIQGRIATEIPTKESILEDALGNQSNFERTLTEISMSESLFEDALGSESSFEGILDSESILADQFTQ